MSLDTPLFLYVFLPLSIFICMRLKSVKVQNYFLVTLSILIISFGQIACIPVLLISCIFNFYIGNRIYCDINHKKTLLISAVAANITVLCIYKYFAFSLSFVNVFINIGIHIPKILLPIGISYFTFQAVSYQIDIYRGNDIPSHSIIDFVLYMSFFPKFLMGPIVEYHDISYQLRDRLMSTQSVADGLTRFCIGLFKNTLIAGTLAAVSDRIFAMNGIIEIRLAWLGAFFYTLELYFDFSGYSDMALGLSHCFGFTFKENFNYPFTALSIRDFWRRWHISLSTWFRDYVYFPLGGSKQGKCRAAANRMLVFAVTGIWHGANWTFLVWGIVHGLLSNLEDIGIIPVNKLNKTTLGRIISRTYTLLAVILLFVVFRADTLNQAVVFLRSMFAGGLSTDFSEVLNSIINPYVVFIFVLALVLSTGCFRALVQPSGKLSKISLNQKVISYICAFISLLLSLIYISGGNFSPSIYSNF